MFVTLLHIDNDQQAETLILAIKAEQEEHDRLVSVCNKQIGVYKEKIAEYALALENGTQQALSLLGVYCKENAKEKNKTKTLTKYKLPSGQLVWKRQSAKTVINTPVLTAWLKEHASQYIKTTEEPVWSDLKSASEVVGNHYEMVTNDGELLVIVGVELVEPSQSEVFEVR